ncbi:MAG: exonuclease domain-containing protein, partial [Pseudomonadota bacterium]|nr:exonuclease domain-containing protein [Pseudomonadota bacterium]
MLKALQHWYNRRQLKYAQFAFLFEPPVDDECVCFDCETTSLNVKKAQLLSLGAVKIKDNKILTS